ncbi:zinc finger, CCHC-type containing protein [Tanacetum coccineum]
MHFLLSSMSVVYVLTTHIPEDGENATVDQIRRRNKWDNNDYVCRGLILKGMSDPLFDIYQSAESSKELWDSLEAKYMAKDASSKKFLVSNFTNYKMTDSRPVMEQYNELLERFQAYFEKHNKEELTLVKFGSHLRIEKSLRAQDSDKPKGNNVVGPQRFWFQELNIANDIGNSAFMSTFKLNDSIIWHARLGHVHFKRMQDMSKDGLIPAFDMNTEKFCNVNLLHDKDEALDKFKVFKIKVELQQGSLIKRFRTDKGGEYMDTLYFQSVGIITRSVFHGTINASPIHITFCIIYEVYFQLDTRTHRTVRTREEIEELIEDQPLPDDTSSTALSSGYIANYPTNRGDNFDNESSDDDNDDDDVEKDEEDEEDEEEEYLAPVNPSAVPTDDSIPLS